MRSGELAALAVIIVAVVVRGWPRRRADRWRLTFRIDRDRSDDEEGSQRRREEPPGSSGPAEP